MGLGIGGKKQRVLRESQESWRRGIGLAQIVPPRPDILDHRGAGCRSIVSPEFIADVTQALGDASIAIDREGRDRKLARRLGSFAATARKTDGSSEVVVKRTTALADTLDDVAARLR